VSCLSSEETPYTILDNLVLNLFSLVKINIDVNTRKKTVVGGERREKFLNFLVLLKRYKDDIAVRSYTFVFSEPTKCKPAI
jgi:hypothetical protein